MASEEEQKKDDAGKGFAGLSSMVSDVETIVMHASQDALASTERPSATERMRSMPASHQEEPRSDPQSYQTPAQSSVGSSTGKWLLGIAAVIGLIWLASESGNESSPPAPAFSPSTQSPVDITLAPSWQPPPVQTPAPGRPSEEKPPVGGSNILTTTQIQYCLAEDIRLNAAKDIVNNYSNSDVDRFNGMVADYNSRCGEFRYRRGTLESARAEIERYRSQLQGEGRGRFVQHLDAMTRATPSENTRPKPNTTVQIIQLQLNEFGYDAGIADGFIGAKTRAAISAFESDYGLDLSGKSPEAMLQQLRLASQNINAY